jgi:hypothetical protein
VTPLFLWLKLFANVVLLMTKYTIWVGGERSWNRSYLAEIGGVELTKEQVDKYFEITEAGDVEFDHDLLAEKTDCWNEENTDLPTWDTITDGCMGWGAYTDQYVGVCKADDDDNPLFLAEVEDLSYYSEQEIKDGDPLQDEQDTAICECEEELVYPKGVWIVYNSYEKGGYEGSFELPDDEEFHPKHLVIHVRSIAENFQIVVGATYKDIDIEMTGDSDGKGIDWYVAHKDNLISFR